jgi:septal ring factor EnvC (AmiA/AmiB activator)
MKALGTLVEAAVGSELRAIRDLVSALESSMGQRVESAVKDAGATVEAAKKEMAAQLDAFRADLDKNRKAQADSLAAAQAKLDASIADMQQRLKQFGQKTVQDITAARDQMAKKLGDYQQKMASELETMVSRLNGEEQELAALQKEEQRIASVLSSFARAFTGTEHAPMEAPKAAAAQPKPAAQPKQPAPPPPPPPPAAQPQQPPAQQKAEKTTEEINIEDLPDSGAISDNIDKMFNLGQ